MFRIVPRPQMGLLRGSSSPLTDQDDIASYDEYY